MGKKVTLKDIAKDSGLSVSTVSRALARSGKISSDNEKKVFESAQRLNYPLTVTDTPWELRKSINIALVTFLYTGEFFSSLFHGFDIATRGTNAQIRLLSVSNAGENAVEIIASLEQSNFDAAVVFLPDFKENDYRKLLDAVPASFPLFSAAPIVNPVIDTVTFDHYRGGFIVANHFRERGFRKVGIIQGPASKSEAMLRKNGFIDFINESEELSLVWEYKADYSLESGIQAYRAYRGADEKPEAVFCSNDDVAIGFMHSAVRDGVRIPEDVAIAGFDDLPKCQYYTPTITSVNTPYDLLGKKVIDLIQERIKGENAARHSGYTSLVPVSLSVRESTTELTDIFQRKHLKD
ncbi:MAG: LacI family DNA-binding transcriptional regulator [Cyclonatronaceae bacterium]